MHRKSFMMVVKKSKKILSLFVCMTMLLTMMPRVIAAAAEDDFEFDASTGTITQYLGNGGNVVIPSSINGMAVTSIGETAFYDNRSVTSVTIPEGVTNICRGAFKDCRSLKNITIPASVNSIGAEAFYQCSSLTNVTLPNGITSIEMSAFSSCKNLKSINIPNSVTSIGQAAFAGCESLESITIPDGVKRIEKSTFGMCTKLKNVDIPNSVTSIDDMNFTGCKVMTSIKIPSSVTSIGKFVCTSSPNLTIYAESADDCSVKYAIENNIPYKIIGDENVPDEPEQEDKPQSYTISYDANGGSGAPSSQTKTEGVSLNLRTSKPERNGYRFKNWNTEADGSGTSYSSGGRFTNDADTTLYAQWTKDESSITLSHTSVELAKSGTIYLMAYNKSANVTESVRWTSSNTSAAKVESSGLVTAVSAGTVTVTATASDGSTASCVVTVSDESLVLKSQPSYYLPSNESVTLNVSSEGSSVGNINIVIEDADQVELMRQKTKSTTWNASGRDNEIVYCYAEGMYNGKVIRSNMIQLQINKSPEIKTLKYSDLTSSNVVLRGEIIRNHGLEIVGYGFIIENKSTGEEINLVCGGKSFENGIYEEEIDFLSPATKYAYTFYVISAGGSQQTEGETFTFTVPASTTTYAITFNPNGGSLSSSNAGKTVTSGSTYGTLPTPVRNGYKFEGWYTGTSSGTKITSSTKVEITSNQTLYAHWSEIKDKVQESDVIDRGTCGGNVVWALDSEGTLTISGTGDIYDRTEAPWYSRRDSITSAVIGSGVTRIGDSAFYECSNLKSVTIPDSVTSIGTCAFLRCESLTSITIPDSVTSIDETAFGECSNLKSVTIPESVTSIGAWTFADCSRLTSVTIPDSVTSIGDHAFEYCSNLKNVTIPDRVTSIGEVAFLYCESLTSVSIPNSVTRIGQSAFYQCKNLTSATIGNNVESIEQQAFSCSGLTSITIPDSVKNIGADAFSWCSNLESVTIPDSVTEISNSAFSGCERLTDVYYAGSEAEWNIINIGEKNDPLYNATIHFNSTVNEPSWPDKKSFPDVLSSASYAEAVNALANRGIINGYEDGSFHPDSTITRAEVAAVIVRMLGLEGYAKQGATIFTDVVADHWASGYINMAQSRGIINGMGDGTFAPSAEVKYEQIVKMLVAGLGRSYDQQAINHGGYPQGYIYVANQEGITNGVSGYVGQSATRATVAMLVYNTMKRK